MKISILILIVSIVQVSASTSAQTVTINENNVPMAQVLKEIRKQSGYKFIIDGALLRSLNPVSVSVKDATVQEALSVSFSGQQLSYEIVEKTIFIKRMSDAMELSPPAPARQQITGKVTDQKTGNPLPGVTVRVKNTDIGTVSDAQGMYTIDADPDGVLIFTFVGYKTLEIKMVGQIRIDMTMVENEAQLIETVIKGYYNTSKELNTGNVTTIMSPDITKQPVSDPLAALQGRIPGMFVQQTSGAPGRSFNIAIRGRNSISNGNEPLYIVDGVQFNSTPLNSSLFSAGSQAAPSPFNNISPSDIESITVLKDADATAIYGSRGANGVILITTKKGSDAKTTFSLNTYQGLATVAKRLNLMKTPEYLDMRRQALANDNLQPGTSDYDLNGAYDQNKYTDWQKVMIGGTAPITDIQGSLSGGNNYTQFRMGLGYRKEGSVFPGNNYMNRINGSISLSHRSQNNRLTVSFAGNYVTGENKMPNFDMTRNIFLAPNAPEIYDASGNLNWQNNTWVNPFAEIVKRYTERSTNLGVNSSIAYEILPGLNIDARLGYNRSALDQSVITPFSSINPTFSNPNSRRSISLVDNYISSWVIEPQASYSTSIGIGKIDVLLGATFQGTSQELLGQSASGFANDDQIESIVAATTKNITEYIPSEYRYNAIYARIGYNVKQKYIINLTGRRDGSSRFGPGRQFGNFGAMGAAWIFSKERWLRSNSIFSYGKLRTSYGVTGNDRLGDYKYLSTYTYTGNTYQGYSGLNPTQLTNPTYGWETVNKFEAGLETTWFNSKLTFNLSYYRNRTGNQLVGYDLPSTTGFSTVLANLPAVVQNTGVEIELGGELFHKENFKWAINFNISIPKNILVSYPNIESSGNASRYKVGMPLSITNVYVYNGIDPLSKLYSFQDINGDGQITSGLDRQFIKTGESYFGGLNNSFTYKAFQLDVFFSYVKQIGRNYLYYNIPGRFIGGNGNQLAGFVESSEYQKLTTSNTDILTRSSLFDNSSGRYSDASYIRLKNVTLSWKFPFSKFMNKILQSGSIFLTAQNLFTITNYKGLDPESQSDLRLPPLRVFAFGINANL